MEMHTNFERTISHLEYMQLPKKTRMEFVSVDVVRSQKNEKGVLEHFAKVSW